MAMWRSVPASGKLPSTALMSPSARFAALDGDHCAHRRDQADRATRIEETPFFRLKRSPVHAKN